MTGKILGKISSVRFGFIPDMPFLFGLDLMFKLGDGSGIGTGGAYTVNVSKECKWTTKERETGITEMVDKVGQILHDAKVSNVYSLKDIPVEVTIEGNTFRDFRILTEVL